MISEVVRFNAVDRIDGAPLELVDVAGDDLGTLLRVRDQQRNLVPIWEFAKTIKGAVPHFEIAVARLALAELTHHTVEVKD